VLDAVSLSETSTSLKNVTRLSSLEDYIDLCRPEIFKAYKFTLRFRNELDK